MSEYEISDVLRIARASDQIAAAIVDMKPALRRHGVFKHQTWYDMRGVVDDIPRLAIVFTTSVGLSAGVQIPPPETGLSHILLLPQLFRHDWNVRFIMTQAVVQHELAHILLDHDYAHGLLKPKTAEYFNHPTEIDAYMHEAIARLASYGPSQQFSWTSGPLTPQELLGDNSSDFTTRVIEQYYPKAMQSLTPQNKGELILRLNKLHREALQTLELEEPEPIGPRF